MGQPVLEVESVVKQYHRKTAVDGVSFSVQRGEILGFLGPNGAGKTTTLRMIMGITAPDSGRVTFRIEGMQDPHRVPKQRIGYLPEERGLYKEARVMDVLLFLASIKGMRRDEARRKALEWLERFELSAYATAKIEELSKGMAQKVQFIAAILHEPDLVVLDEPFSGLDPVNQNVFREEIRRLADRGAAILLSSHQMNLVEETCDRIFLINNGRRVLYGTLVDIKAQHGVHRVNMLVSDPAWHWRPPDLVQQVSQEGPRWTCLLNPGATPAQFMQWLPEDAPVEEITIARISLHDIFVRMATERAVA